MKKLIIASTLTVLCAAAHAEPLLPKGAKAQLNVEYVFTSAGAYRSPSNDQKERWSVRRRIVINALYTADAPQPFGPMHDKDPEQKAKIEDLKSKGEATKAKLEPTMNDMMKIVADCGGPDAPGAEQCISNKVSNYGNNMQVPSDLQQTKDTIISMGKPGAPRFQLWRQASQSGSYSIDEHQEKQIFEMTCTEAKVCKRTTTVKGGGEISAPPGRSISGASMFEVDASRKDIVLTLPTILMPLETQTVIETSIPNDKNSSAKTFAKPIVLTGKPITVAIKSDRLEATGAQTIKIDGVRAEGGTLTVNWSLKPL